MRSNTKYLFTFDYELFLGPETGSVERCLIEPTSRLLEICRSNNVKFVFFVDTLFIIKLQEAMTQCDSLKEDFQKVLSQLKQAANEGHDLELHLHPQWYYSSYDPLNSKWVLDYTHYKLSDCPFEDVKNMINLSCVLLRNLTGKNPCAYRAGGYSAPDSKLIWDLLFQNGIRYDSSVIIGDVKNTQYQYYNYSKITTLKNYRFTADNSIEDPNGKFVEYPIASISIRKIFRAVIEKPILKIYARQLKVFGDGVGIGLLYNTITNNKRESYRDRIVIKSSIDFRNAVWAWRFIRVFNKEPFLTFIGHPKNQSVFSLKKLEQLLNKKRIYKNVITFRELT